jgi:hypothetical protein
MTDEEVGPNYSQLTEGQEGELRLIAEAYLRAANYMKWLSAQLSLADRAMKQILIATPGNMLPVDVSLAEAALDPRLILSYGEGAVELMWITGDSCVPFSGRRDGQA